MTLGGVEHQLPFTGEENNQPNKQTKVDLCSAEAVTQKQRSNEAETKKQPTNKEGNKAEANKQKTKTNNQTNKNK